jgi:hypothetical protein
MVRLDDLTGPPNPHEAVEPSQGAVRLAAGKPLYEVA